MTNRRMSIARKLFGAVVLATVAAQGVQVDAYSCSYTGGSYYVCVQEEVGRCEHVDVPGFCNFICQSAGMNVYLSFCENIGDQLIRMECVCTCPSGYSCT